MAVPAGKLHLNMVLRILEETILQEEGLREKLVCSLKTAKALGAEQLKKDIYDYFDVAFDGCGWPTNIVDYMEYVKLYLTQVPFAFKVKKHDHMKASVMKSPAKYGTQPLLGAYDVYHQCVYYEIVHFYWLVGQKLPDGTTLQSDKLFASWIKIFGVGQGIFLNTPESLTPKTLETFFIDPLYNMEWYKNQRDDWKCWNAFFCRQFNDADPVTGLSPLRPIDPDKYVITAPADCTYQEVFRIDENGKLMDLSGNAGSYNLKRFSKGCTVQELLTDNCAPFWKDFYGGTYIHYFLSPYDYHRFHTPVGGIVAALETINGQNFLAAAITDDGEFDAPDDATNGYEFRQERGLVIVDNEDLGKVACLPIGMAQVSSVHMYKDKLLYREVPKGQEFGYFLFGGSDIILLIPKPVEQLSIIKEGYDKQPLHFKYGQAAVVYNAN